jgi:hypothetical protein
MGMTMLTCDKAFVKAQDNCTPSLSRTFENSHPKPAARFCQAHLFVMLASVF